jgi:hypothetical protein
MSFDPNLPQENTPADAGQMRGQLNALKALIDAIPHITAVVVDGVTTLNPGEPATVSINITGTTLHVSFGIPAGADGAPGPPFASAVVDATNTLPPGSAASVSVSFDGTNVHFTFGIPRGEDGTDGAPGPPFAGAVVDAVNTLPPGDPATVSVSFDGTNVHFTFGIHAGADGAPGEVTTAALDAAIAGTSANTNAVATLDTPFADPDSESLRSRLNELILTARRP